MGHDIDLVFSTGSLLLSECQNIPLNSAIQLGSSSIYIYLPWLFHSITFSFKFRKKNKCESRECGNI